MLELQKLMDDVLEWSSKTFKNESTISKSIHLQKEAIELTEALEKYYRIPSQRHKDDVKFELADGLMLIGACAKLFGISSKELIAISYIKLEVNKNREWEQPDENGVCYHKKQ